jgi:hypothetical protein
VRFPLGGVVAIKEFYLDESLEWDVTTHRTWNSYLSKEVVTDEDLIEVIKGHGECSMGGSDDGPEFKALRNQLEELGYITCERGWWNGDRVVKPFKLNDLTFKKGEQFSSGAALKFHMGFLRKRQSK